jgi:hypothetical protein
MRLNLKSKLTAVVLGTCLNSSVFADILPNLYFGVEGQYHYYKMEKTLKSSAGGVITRGNNRPLFQESNIAGSVFIGTSLFDIVGIEAGYEQFKNSHTNDNLVFNMAVPGVSALQVLSNNQFTARHHNGYVDVIGCFPVPLGLDFIASIGAGCLTSRVLNTTNANAYVAIPPRSQSLSGSSSMTARSTEVGLRLGLGTQYKFGDVGARFMVRYQKGNDLIRTLLSANVGVFFQFY